MIKKLGLIMGFYVLGNTYACDTPTKYCNPKSLSNNDIEIISQAIYKIEGGQKTKYPFGIKSSIPTAIIIKQRKSAKTPSKTITSDGIKLDNRAAIWYSWPIDIAPQHQIGLVTKIGSPISTTN